MSIKEAVSEDLDWREQFKKRPVAWSLGAAGGGFLLGCAIAGINKKPSGHRDASDYALAPSTAPAAVPLSGPVTTSRSYSRESNRRRHELRGSKQTKEAKGGLLERLQETEAYDQLRREAAAVGSRLISEVSQTAREVVLPAAISWLRQWLSGLASPKTTNKAASEAGSPIPSEASASFRSP